MNLLRQIVAWVVLAACAAGIVLCMVGLVYIWRLREPLLERTEVALARVDKALASTARGLEKVNANLERSQAEVQAAADTSSGSLGQASSLPLRLAVPAVQKKLGPNLHEARDNLNTMIEAALVANSFLENVNEFPLVNVSKVETEKLNATAADLSTLATSAQKWGALLTAGSNPNEQSAEELAADIRARLARVQANTADVAARIQLIKADLNYVRNRLPDWFNGAAAILTLALIWIAACQLSLLLHARGWLKWSDATRASASG